MILVDNGGGLPIVLKNSGAADLRLPMPKLASWKPPEDTLFLAGNVDKMPKEYRVRACAAAAEGRQASGRVRGRIGAVAPVDEIRLRRMKRQVAVSVAEEENSCSDPRFG